MAVINDISKETPLPKKIHYSSKIEEMRAIFVGIL